MSVRKRLEKLEGSSAASRSPSEHRRPRHMERLLHAHENGRRELQGLEPLPELPYTEEDREDDRRCLREVIPSYRASSPGWRRGEGKAFLDAWEQSIRERLESLVRETSPRVYTR